MDSLFNPQEIGHAGERQERCQIVLNNRSRVGSLFYKIDEYQKADDFDVIDRLRDENTALQRTIISYRKSNAWNSLLQLLREALESMILLECLLEDFCHIEKGLEGPFQTS
jgi:hypothetical protein